MRKIGRQIGRKEERKEKKQMVDTKMVIEYANWLDSSEKLMGENKTGRKAEIGIVLEGMTGDQNRIGG